MIANLLMLPFRLVWNVAVIALAVTLELLWLGFVFGSVIGVVIMLIFAPGLFLAPLLVLEWTTPLFD